MKIIKWILFTVIALVVIVVLFAAYMGAFSKLEVSEKQMGPYIIVYEDYVGPFSGTGKVIGKIYSSLLNDGVTAESGFGIYYDDPKTTPQNKLRSRLGCIITDKDYAKIAKLAKKYKAAIVTKNLSVVYEFPIRNDLSYMVGAIKVYPELMRHIKAKGYKMTPPMEVYDMKAHKIYYLMEIKK